MYEGLGYNMGYWNGYSHAYEYPVILWSIVRL